MVDPENVDEDNVLTNDNVFVTTMDRPGFLGFFWALEGLNGIKIRSQAD
ncbi:hypothetical protein Hdeb2414_s0010g00354671 [Helianthus debilis subsp. tardiflorus]